MIALISAITATVMTFGFNFLLNIQLKQRDERREGRARMFKNSVPELHNALIQYLQMNDETGWTSCHDTEMLEHHLLTLYRDAVVTGAPETALCNIFRELALELQAQRFKDAVTDNVPRFTRTGGPAKRNYDYVMQAARHTDIFRHWLDLQLLRKSRRVDTTHLELIEIDREKAGEDLSRYDEPEVINGDALRRLLGEGFLDCRVVENSRLPGQMFDIKVTNSAVQDACISVWLSPVDVHPLADDTYTVRCWTNKPTALVDEFPGVQFDEATLPAKSEKFLDW